MKLERQAKVRTRRVRKRGNQNSRSRQRVESGEQKEVESRQNFTMSKSVCGVVYISSLWKYSGEAGHGSEM